MIYIKKLGADTALLMCINGIISEGFTRFFEPLNVGSRIPPTHPFNGPRTFLVGPNYG
jgi:hypothetical protein